MSKSTILHISIFTVLVLVIVFGIHSTRSATKATESVAANAIHALEDNVQEYNMSQEIVRAVLHTSKGNITLELWADKAPQTVQNFITLAQNGFYDGTRFHRVIEGFMIQGGDPLSKDTTQINRWGTGGPGYQFSDEIHENNTNLSGTISMANAGPNTNGSQFFINVADNTYLDTRHTVFGKVVEGYDIVEAISLVDTIPGVDRPIEDVAITSITLELE